MVTGAQLSGLQKMPYESFEGKYVDIMPRLRADDRAPMGILDLFRKKVEVINLYNSDPQNKELREAYEAWVLENYFDSGDGIAQIVRDGIEYAKIEKNSKMLLGITPKARLVGGALPIAQSYYGSIPGPEINVSELRDNGLINHSFTQEQASKQPILRALLEKDLERIVKTIFSQGKQEYGYDTMFGVYLTDADDIPKLRSLGASRLNVWSCVLGNYYLGDNSRLVGVLDKKDGQ